MVLGHPQHVEIRLVADCRQLAQFIEQLGVVALAGEVVQIMEQSEAHAGPPLVRLRALVYQGILVYHAPAWTANGPDQG